ncbi:hypothetical protein B0H13DRAFT_1661157 [Mycena leptocephala]|nr:hypothetical protein B0H13DRAFT_1661157 [Mycena leptocephala]
MSFKGVALVAGAAQGIGRAVALRLASDGFDVAVNDISSNSSKLATLVAELKNMGRASSKYVADVSQEDQVREMVELVVKIHGGLDVVANAGVGSHTLSLTEGTLLALALQNLLTLPQSLAEWDRVININAWGSFLCYKYAGIQMIKQGRGGRIIGASSMAGKQAIPTQGPYSASKFAVRGLTQSAVMLSLEFGASGITLNAYAPGVIDTPIRTCTICLMRYSKPNSR